MKQVEIKKAYVQPKMAELGNVSTITLGPSVGVGGSCSFVFVKRAL